MDGKPFWQKFHPVNTLLGKTINGITDKFLEQVSPMDPKNRNSIEDIYSIGALELRFFVMQQAHRRWTLTNICHVPCRWLIQGDKWRMTLYLILHKIMALLQAEQKLVGWVTGIIPGNLSDDSQTPSLSW